MELRGAEVQVAVARDGDRVGPEKIPRGGEDFVGAAGPEDLDGIVLDGGDV